MFSRLARKQHRLLVNPPVEIVCPSCDDRGMPSMPYTGVVLNEGQMWLQPVADNQQVAGPSDMFQRMPRLTADQAGTMIDVTA